MADIKKLAIYILVLLCLILSSCQKTEIITLEKYKTQEYVLVTVRYAVGDRDRSVYGYMKSDEVDLFLQGKSNNSIKINSPYEEDMFAIIDINKVSSIIKED